jgi:hypothetical protein
MRFLATASLMTLRDELLPSGVQTLGGLGHGSSVAYIGGFGGIQSGYIRFDKEWQGKTMRTYLDHDWKRKP